MGKKYEVNIIESQGTCKNELFEMMAKNGDLTATKVTELLGKIVKVTGYALCNIVTEDKNFDLNYFDTEEYGLISSGSEIFKNSIVDYYDKVEYVRLTEVKTKKGKTYKAVPMLGKKSVNIESKPENKKEVNDDLPF